MQDEQQTEVVRKYTNYPTAADFLKQHFDNDDFEIVDGTKPISEEKINCILKDKKIIYVTDEKFDTNTRLSEIYKGKNANPEISIKYKNNNRFFEYQAPGGVDYNRFSCMANSKAIDKRIGFAGTIDSRIYFAMVQVICEAFPDYEIVFAGEILGEYPAWLSSFENLKYIEANYEELPAIISTFNVCLLPFYGKHKKLIPSELMQYLAEGKNVVASDMNNLPQSSAIYKCNSIDEAVPRIEEALNVNNKKAAMALAKVYSWEKLSGELLNAVEM